MNNNQEASIQISKSLESYNISIDIGTVMACRSLLKDSINDILQTVQPIFAHKLVPGMRASLAIIDAYLKEKGISYETE